MQKKLAVLLFSAMLAPLATASDAQSQPACHWLMTEKECSDHKARLAMLPPGQVRDRYLAEYASTQKEREAVCSYVHASTAGYTKLPQRY